MEELGVLEMRLFIRFHGILAFLISIVYPFFFYISHVVLYNMSWLLDKDVSVADIGALGKLSRPSDSDIGFRRWTSLF